GALPGLVSLAIASERLGGVSLLLEGLRIVVGDLALLHRTADRLRDLKGSFELASGIIRPSISVSNSTGDPERGKPGQRIVRRLGAGERQGDARLRQLVIALIEGGLGRAGHQVRIQVLVANPLQLLGSGKEESLGLDRLPLVEEDL